MTATAIRSVTGGIWTSRLRVTSAHLVWSSGETFFVPPGVFWPIPRCRIMTLITVIMMVVTGTGCKLLPVSHAAQHVPLKSNTRNQLPASLYIMHSSDEVITAAF